MGCPEDNEVEPVPQEADQGIGCTDGETVACFVDGVCAGTQTCEGGVFGPCTGSEEVCDGVDNDCNGSIDEGFAFEGQPVGAGCTAGEGTCAVKGQIVCAGDGSAAICSATAGDGTDEMCDGVDNDCDGTVDEETGGGECDTGRLGACGPGTFSCTDGRETCEPTAERADEVCDGIDNDCDGRADESALGGGALAVPCYTGAEGTEGVGACAPGVQMCADGMLGECVDEVTPATEICDGIDNDCNGEVDDVDGVDCVCNANEVRDCYTGPEDTLGVGDCRGGRQTCTEDGSAWGPCVGEIVPRAEVCDGADNSCDGETDNAAGVGEACSVGQGLCAADGERVCDLERAMVVCDAEPGLPEDEICDGVDNDCDGMVDDVPGAGAQCSVGVGACLARGTLVCGKGDAGGLVCSASPGEPGDEICDNIDNDCNGVIDDADGVGEACEVGVGVCRSTGITVCDAAAGMVICPATEQEGGIELCDNDADDDCDGETDEPECIIPCEVDGDCGPGAWCPDVETGCVPGCRDDEGCGPDELCEENTCVPGNCRDDEICGEGALCIDSFCTPADCRVDEDCLDEGQICDGNFCAAFPTACLEPAGIGFGTTVGSNDGAPSETSGSCGGSGPEVAYLFDPAEYVGTVCATTDGSDFDTVLHVRGDCARAESEVACDDDGGLGFDSQTEFDVDGPAFIFVDRVLDGGGHHVLTITEGPCACRSDGDCAEGETCRLGACVVPECGDGYVEGGEQCDDGGAEPGDGCSDLCEVELGFTCDEAGGPCAEVGGLFAGVTRTPGELLPEADITPGGDAFVNECAGDQIIYGAEATVSPVGIQRMRALCADIELSGDRLVLDPAGGTAPVGNNEVDFNNRLVCPPNHAVSGYVAYNPAGLSLLCTPVSLVDGRLTFGEPIESASIGVALLERDRSSCPEGTAAGAHAGRASAGGVQGFSLRCDLYADDCIGASACEQIGECIVDEDCEEGFVCNEAFACVEPVGSCEVPTMLMGPGTVEGNTLGQPAIETETDPDCVTFNPGQALGPEAVIAFTGVNPGPHCFSTRGSAIDTVLYVRADACDDPAAEVACNDDNGPIAGGLQSAVTVDVAADATYYAFVDRFGNGAGGPFVLTVTEGECAPPEVCGNGALGGAETCDDGNSEPGDGCDENCQIEEGFDCIDPGLGECGVDQPVETAALEPRELLPAIGGQGGEPFDDACAPGEVVIGFDYAYGGGFQADSYISQSQAVCATFEVAPDGITITERGTTPLRGGTANEITNVRCGDGSVVVGYVGHDDGGYVSGVEVYCASIDVVDGIFVYGEPVAQPLVGRMADAAGPHICPEGQIVGGNAGRAGAIIDNFTMRCYAVVPACDNPSICRAFEVCDDGVDNDGDRAADCADDDCFEDPACEVLGTGVCEDPFALPGLGLFLGSTADAPSNHVETDPDCVTFGDDSARSPEHVYAFTAPEDGALCFSLGGSSFDTVMYAREATCDDPAAEVACNDDSGVAGATQSAIDLDVTAGTTYYVFVDGFGLNSAGDYQLEVRQGPCVIPPEACDNGVDDDFDGAVDCDDADCAEDPLCLLPACVPDELEAPDPVTIDPGEYLDLTLCAGDQDPSDTFFVDLCPGGTLRASFLHDPAGEMNLLMGFFEEDGPRVDEQSVAGVVSGEVVNEGGFPQGAIIVSGTPDLTYNMVVEVIGCDPAPVEICDSDVDDDDDGTIDCADADCADDPACAEVFPVCASETFDGPDLPAGFETEGAADWFIDGESFLSPPGAASSGDIGDDQESRLRTQVTVPAGGTVSFRYRVSSEGCCDELFFAVDGVQIAELDQQDGWREFRFGLDPGEHLLEWYFEKDGSVSNGEDRAQIDDLTVYAAAGLCDLGIPPPEVCDNGVDDNDNGDVDCDDAGCAEDPACIAEICDNDVDDDGDRRVDCADDECADDPACAQVLPACEMETFDGPLLPVRFATEGDAPWFIDGESFLSPPGAASSGDIGNNQESRLRTAVSVPAGGDLSFRYRVSSEDGFDTLRFFVDGVQVAEVDQQDGWRELRQALDPGEHVLEWVYQKDGSASEGEDRAQIDDVAIFAAACGLGLEQCTNGVDDNGNGDIDCADAGCAEHPACNPLRTEVLLERVEAITRVREANLGDLIADSMRWRAMMFAMANGAPAPQVALTNAGGIRGDTNVDPGTELDAAFFDETLPFGNTIVIVDAVERADFRAMLENAVSGAPNPAGRFAQISGFDFVWNTGAPVGERVMSATLSDGTVIVNGGAVVDGPPLVMATNSFVAGDQDGYVFPDDQVDTAVDMRDGLRDFIIDQLAGVVTAEDYPEGGESRITARDPEQPGVNCDDGVDNNGNGATDCEDPACIEDAACAQPALCIADDQCVGNAVCRPDGLISTCIPTGSCVEGGDAFEPNDTSDAAARLPGEGRYTPGAICGNESDFFTTGLCPGGTITVDIYFTHGDGDLELEIVGGANSESSSDDESVSFTNDGAEPVDVLWRVYEFGDPSNGYAMDVTIADCGVEDVCDDGEDNDLDGATDCDDADCAEDPACQPEAPLIVITEVMQNPAVVSDANGEWFEVHNPTGADIDLSGWTFTEADFGDAFTIAGELIVPAGGYAVLGRNGDEATNGGVALDYVYGADMNLGNTNDDIVIFDPFDNQISSVAWDNGATFPDPNGASMSFDGGLEPTVENIVVGANWCEAITPYSADNTGTPGAPNDVCPVAANAVDFCRLQFPESIEDFEGATVIVYGRLFEAGITDDTPGTDPAPGVMGQAGYIMDGADPADPANWTWFDAIPNDQYDGNQAGEPNNDEYQADMLLPAEGLYSYAYRFTVDDGVSWTMCDLDGAGANPDAGQFDIAQAGVMLTEVDPCFEGCADAAACGFLAFVGVADEASCVQQCQDGAITRAQAQCVADVNDPPACDAIATIGCQ